MKLKIEKGIPIPDKNNGSGICALLRKMAVGDSILLDRNQTRSITSASRSVNVKITQRRISETQSRIWRIK